MTKTIHRDHGPFLQHTSPGNKALRRGRVSLPQHVYFVTSSTVKRQRFFTHFEAACAAARCFEDDDILGDKSMLAWVLMPDHAHWLVQLGRTRSLDHVVNRIKSSSARFANRVLHRSGSLWQAGYYDHAVRHDENLKHLARYIVANPIRSGLVQHIHNYPFWNAVWL